MQTPQSIWEAAREGNVALLTQHLVNSPSALCTPNEDGRLPIHEAVSGNHNNCTEVTAFLLQQGSPVNIADEAGWTPLHIAASLGNVEVISLLLKAKAEGSPETTTGAKCTPLHYAASKGRVEAVKMLLSAGASPLKRDALGNTALHRAAAAGASVEVVREILQAEGEKKRLLEAENSEGETALMLAVSSGHEEIAALLRNELQ